MKIKFPSLSENERLARSAISGFVALKNPQIDELSDIKTAVSEAVTNSIVHGYRNTLGEIEMTAKIFDDNTVYIRIKDKGVGIEDIKQAMTPLFTTLAQEERSGLGFSVMESFCDSVRVSSKKGAGTTVVLTKRLRTKL
ncbi:MAG: anti-sigma F factor [Oscillospiraceae bacterium]|nr:anti-sigma F factor [Oscillospiraceae bacterium]